MSQEAEKRHMYQRCQWVQGKKIGNYRDEVTRLQPLLAKPFEFSTIEL